MRMRFRTDGWHYADLKAHGWTFDGPEGADKVYGSCFRDDALGYEEAKKVWDGIPKAEPGDVWRTYWSHHEGDGPQIDDRVAGYAICCPGCGHVHSWVRATNCSQKVEKSYVDTNTGETVKYQSCVHEGVSSCWTWSGSAEEGTLTAAPSLQVQQEDCKWHGFIQNGDIHN